MKYLLSVLFVLALFCGVTSYSHAQPGGNFHVGVVDPNTCNAPSDPSACTIQDATGPVTGPFTFEMSACLLSGIPAGSYCLDLFNASGVDITSITLSIPDSDLGGQTPVCDTTSAFMGSCTTAPGGLDIFSFIGNFPPRTIEDIYVAGLNDPSVLTNADVAIEVAATPEPDSLLLFATGAMMAGLYLTKRPLLSAFGKK
jgi:hypothetical protein